MTGDGSRCRVVVLISGRGSNLQSLIDQWRSGALAIDLCAVISNEPQAQGLERAKRAGVPTAVVAHRAFPDRATFSRALVERIDDFRPDLVVLAGFMRVLSDEMVGHFAGRERLAAIAPQLGGVWTGARGREELVGSHGR